MSDLQSLPTVLTAGEVASYLRVSKTTICRWCKDGRLPAFRLGRSWRVQRRDLEDHIKRAACMGEDPRIRLATLGEAKVIPADSVS